VCIARATAEPRAHACSAPPVSRAAAASAAKSADAWARCRAITADPTHTAPIVIDNSTAIIATATTLAEPWSSALDRGHRFRRDGDAR
jgi:hypothetical protein